ncbi:MAG: hypothetical protein WBO95_13100 [Candidatus Dechloromonas phosphoritropha]|jgi:hypothetical protein
MAASCHILLPGVESIKSGERLADMSQRLVFAMHGPAHVISRDWSLSLRKCHGFLQELRSSTTATIPDFS